MECSPRRSEKLDQKQVLQAIDAKSKSGYVGNPMALASHDQLQVVLQDWTLNSSTVSDVYPNSLTYE